MKILNVELNKKGFMLKGQLQETDNINNLLKEFKTTYNHIKIYIKNEILTIEAENK